MGVFVKIKQFSRKWLKIIVFSNSGLQSCASLLPNNVDFSQKRDILIANTFDNAAKYDWASLSNVITKVYSIGKYRTATFRLHMTSTKCLDFYEKLATEFQRLWAEDEKHQHRSIIYPRCANYRTEFEKKLFFNVMFRKFRFVFLNFRKFSKAFLN